MLNETNNVWQVYTEVESEVTWHRKELSGNTVVETCRKQFGNVNLGFNCLNINVSLKKKVENDICIKIHISSSNLVS